MIKFFLLVNKQGQTRLASYYDFLPMDERIALQSETIRRCLSRSPAECSILEYRGYRIVYRRYASLFFIVGIDRNDENELATLELIHAYVESLDKHFENVSELDIMFNLEKAHMILDEMIMNGYVTETNKRNILEPVRMMEKVSPP